jgi:hypothetical protein
MYTLAIEDTLDFPVTLDVQSGRVRRNFFFHLSARRLSLEQYQQHFGPKAENPHQSVTDFLQDHITGWRGQQLVLQDGKPADFSPEAFGQMLTVLGAEMLIFMAYQKAIFANDGDAGRRKNSGG